MSPAASPTDGPPVLGIETATFCGGVAVAQGAQVRGELMHRSPRSHSERLLPAVEALLNPLGLAVAELGAIAVSAGPGSFTGLRVGAAAAKGLAYSLDVPLYGIPTLELLAANAPGADAVRAVLDARRGELFTALYRCRSGSPEVREDARIVTPEDLVAILEPGTLVVGELPPPVEAELSDRPDIHLAPPHLRYPRAAAAALAGAGRLATGVPSETATFTPIYLRPSDAETNRKTKQKTIQ